jgi:putative alpha-1,2-mannosidase
MQGGELVFEMASEPNLARGMKPEDKPYSMTE